MEDRSSFADWLNAGPGMVSTAVELHARVVEQQPLARDTYRLRIECPALASQIVPGQFFMVRPAGGSDPLLGRPFALYDSYLNAAGEPAGIDLVYHVIGKATGLMSQWTAGDAVDLWGPLGNGFPAPTAARIVCVGGGIGYTPFLAVAREAAGMRQYGRALETQQAPRSVSLLYGVRSREHRADLSDFDGIPGFDVRIATDDGSEGHHGFVTELLSQELDGPAGRRPGSVYCCGPEPMMHAVARLCESAGVDCWLSLETPMACGFGACFSCVTRVKVDEAPGWDYRRTCVEGPVFPASMLALGPA